jgi:BolA protein
MSVQDQISQKLMAALRPSHLEVENESHMHSVPANSETHFKLVVVSPEFDGKRSVSRHQLIYKVLADELAGSVHALAIHTYTEPEWAQRNTMAPESPQCMGGSKAE